MSATPTVETSDLDVAAIEARIGAELDAMGWKWKPDHPAFATGMSLAFTCRLLQKQLEEHKKARDLAEDAFATDDLTLPTRDHAIEDALGHLREDVTLFAVSRGHEGAYRFYELRVEKGLTHGRALGS